jgi:hypothetical protein
MAQLVRRFLYIVAAISAPLFFDVYARLPYLLSGGFSVLLSLFVICKIEKHRRENAKRLARIFGRNRDSIGAMDPRRFSFATQEVLSRIGSLANPPDKLRAELSAIEEDADDTRRRSISEILLQRMIANTILLPKEDRKHHDASQGLAAGLPIRDCH